jgi:uncharacterized protein (DUF1330 family)
MPAYIIADVSVTDLEGYAEYRDKVPALIAAHGGNYLARGGPTEVLEGTWEPRRTVIVEFPSMAALKGFWDSPEYTHLRAIRNRTADSNIVATEGLA